MAVQNNTSCNRGIVLNRMYTGSYLSTNLGHEVINMFATDNGNHYLYLNARGNVVEKGLLVQHMLLVMYLGDNRVEVLGLAKNLTAIDSAKVSLSGSLETSHEKITADQKKYIREEKIEYGGVSILDIFGDAGQQSVYVSYKAESLLKPKKRIILQFKHNKQDSEQTEFVKNILISNHNFSSTSLHQFIMQSEGNDYVELEKIISDPIFWNPSDEKVHLNSLEIREPSLFDICEIQNNENVFSNALAYYIVKYPDLFGKIFDFKRLISVNREVNAKVKDKKWSKETGGRIDLLIKSEDSYIVIENKIKSGINRVEADKEGENQLSRYKKYTEWLEKYDRGSKMSSKLIILCPDYNIPAHPADWKRITYSEVCSKLEPSVKNFNDNDFKAFYHAMKRHSNSSYGLSLYEDMKNLFNHRIMTASHK